MTNMNTADFLKAVDHAAMMNDRWLFLAAFSLLLAACALVIYWLVRQLQAVITDHERLRDEHHEALKKIINNQNETTMKLAVCLDRNTQAFQECSYELRRFKERSPCRTGD